MKIKKYLLFICAIIILVMSVSLPYLLLALQDQSLYNRNVVEKVESSENESKNLTTLQKLKIISRYKNNNSSVYTVDGELYSFPRELKSEEIDSIYQQIQKLYHLNGIIEIPKENIEQYYQCTINTYQQDAMTIILIKISFFVDNMLVNLWVDNDTYMIYQYYIESKNKNTAFKQLDIHDGFRNYLNLEKKNFANYYSIYQGSSFIGVIINHIDAIAETN